MQINQCYILQEVQAEYILAFDSKGHAYFEIHKGMYGLKEAAILPNDHQLRDHLAKYGYEPFRHTLVWGVTKLVLTHYSSNVWLGYQVLHEDDTNDKFSAIQDKHSITIDWSSGS